MTDRPDPLLQVLHTVRTLGYADVPRIAARAGLPEDSTAEHLADLQAEGAVTRSAFAGDSGWSLTEAGKAHGEHLLAQELDARGARSAVEACYRDFLPLNDVVARACSDWQLAELGIGGKPVSLEETVAELRRAADAWESIEARLVREADRFAGYSDRFSSALAHAEHDPRWITGTDLDSAHRVWFELHEDLIATLGLTR
ncbi:hypothetical protein QUV83_06495 [Cellulomonas cellasea]|uniref:hypothetical protein n=1 Tax=Cellulomonas cellasea TaxID=43670 RepID=UPI0025A3DEAF|nr:hypothetical protein [Cellulomonas cellasea]MDM8084409.1 hypothetical protein [Cellulomonas cellasea]